MYSKLVGNEPVKDALRRFMAAGRVPQAFLFAGPSGVGKKQFALELARSFACTSQAEGEACGECSACRRSDVFVLPTLDKKEDYEQVLFSEHPDIGIVIPFKNNVRVDAIRDLEREANFRPYEARARFFIVDEAEKMSDSAANALLKTLEEPAPTSHIVLVTSRPDSLLQTIRSRCQVIRFGPVAADEIERLLAYKGIAPSNAAVAAKLAAGSVTRAIQMDIEDFSSKRLFMLELLENAVLEKSPSAVLQASEAINDAKNKGLFDLNLEILQTLVHDIFLLQNGVSARELTSADLVDRLSRLAQSSERTRIADWLDMIESVRAAGAVNINRRIASDALFVAMSSR